MGQQPAGRLVGLLDQWDETRHPFRLDRLLPLTGTSPQLEYLRKKKTEAMEFARKPPCMQG